MDVLRCVKCKSTYYTPNARTLLQGDPRCSHCHSVLMYEGQASIHGPEPADEEPAGSVDG